MTLVTPFRAATAGLLVVIVVALWPSAEPQSRDWYVGTVERGSLEKTGYGYRFNLLLRAAGDTTADRIVVRQAGDLDETVCEGYEAFVSRDSKETALFSTVSGFNDGKYDHCWEQRCDREAYDRCRGPQRFE